MFKQTLTIASLLIAAGTCSQAGIVGLITAPDSNTYSPDFSLLGANHTNVSNGASVDGITTISDSDLNSPAFTTLIQSLSWNGNFSPGQTVLANNGNGPDIFAFSIAQQGFGVQIQDNSNFGPFTATISAFDATHTLLGTFTEDGQSNTNADGSAIFIGVTSDSADIASVELSIGGDNFGVAQTIPEPASFVLMGSALIVAGRFARRGKK